jgi:hypothetical protein
MGHKFRPSCVCRFCADTRLEQRERFAYAQLTAQINHLLRRLRLYLWASRPSGLLISREDWIKFGLKKPLHTVPDLVIGATR